MWIITTLGALAAIYLIVIIYVITTFKGPEDPYGN